MQAKLLIESKIKSFIRKALSGYDINILLDIVQGLFISQTQAARTVATLLCNNKISLCDDQWNPIAQADYNGEKLEKITLTYGDYGFFQDRMLVDGIMEDITNHGFSLEMDTVPEDVLPASNRKA